MKKRILFAAGVVMFCAFCAQAELIYIAIEADVDYVLDPCDHLEGKITTSSTITGYYCYESTTADSNPLSSAGSYWHYSSPSGMHLTCGGFDFSVNTSNQEFLVGVENNMVGDDKYFIGSNNNLPLSNGVTVSQMFWQLEDNTMAALSSDALPLTAPVLGDWDDNRLYISGGPRGAEFGIDATVTFAEPVPEPVTIILMSLGTALIPRERSV